MAQKRYETFGPYSFPSSLGGFRQSLKQMWNEVGSQPNSSELAAAVGVYVWAYKDGKRLVPWNVGKTDRQSFQKRFTQKERSFLKFRQDHPDAEIAVFFLALRTPTGRLRRPTERQSIGSNDWLEALLIGAARAKNPQLRNFSKIKKLNTIVVDGYLNDDEIEPSASAKAFRALLA